jgi:Tfp pilus assembly protein PilF
MSMRHRSRLLSLLVCPLAVAGVLTLHAATTRPSKPSKPVNPAGSPTDKADELVRLNNLGIAYLAQYKPAEAEKQFREAIALDSSYQPGHVNAGIASLAQVRYTDAIAEFRKALEIDPGSIHAHFNLSLIYKIQGNAADALTEGLKAMEADPRDPDIHYQVGSLYMTLRDNDKAITEFDTVVKLDPNFLSAYYSLGRAWMAKGDIEKGKKFIEKHRELQAGSSATPAVGLRYGEQGRYSYAMEDTGGSGPTPPLEKGTVTLVDVSTTAGIAWVHGGGSLDALRATARAPIEASLESLRRNVGPLLGSGVALADVDGDGREDLFFPNASADGKAESSLYLNRGGFKFEKASGAAAPAVGGSAVSAAFGDLDGDGDPDLVVALEDRLKVLLNDGKGSFRDVSMETGIGTTVSGGLLGGVSLADVDHDGDLDIFAAGFLGVPPAKPAGGLLFPTGWPGTDSLLFINTTAPPVSPGAPATVRFVESAAKARLDHAHHRATGAVFGDFDNDRDIDLVLASPGEPTTLFSNMRDGTFKDLAATSGLPGNAPVMGVASADYNKDGWMDLAATTWDGGLPRLFRNMMGDPLAGLGKGGAFALDVNAMSEVSRQIAVPQFGVAFIDIDNDGYLDLVTVNGTDVGPALFVFRNEGDGRFTDAGGLVGADQIPARNGRGLAVADLDQDGDLDLVVSNSGASPTMIRNDGGNRNHWVRIAPSGLHSNRPGVGTKIEVKAGRMWQKIEVQAGSGYLSQSSLVPHFGLGSRPRVDTVRLLWPGGVLQDELQVKADSLFAVKELDRKGSSCPILYAWNGEKMAFVSDFLGGSAIGERIGLTTYNYPDTDEYVRVTAEQLRPKDGRLELRMVNQLEETIFFDRVRLLAVDHSSDDEMFPDERLMPDPPFPAFRVFTVRNTRTPAAAHDDTGRDLVAALSRIDRVYAEPPPSTGFRGYSREHTLTLDLGPLPPNSPVLLLLYGWIDYADSTSNLAAAQAGVRQEEPSLDALDGDHWVKVLPQMGSPAGLPKTMTLDLTGKLPAGSHTVRITTSLRIYWDQVRIATELGPPPRITAVEPSLAELRYRGFPELVTPDGRAPESYDYAKDQTSIHWKTMSGFFTRYGSVVDLLGAVDDRYIITRPGDEIAVEFPAAGLPPLPPATTRDYLLFVDGFGKDMDLNSGRPETVAPLPFHAMRSYPPERGQGYPYGNAGLMEYLDAYNTRLVVSPLLPIRPPR